jgi:hypothetical protein
MNSKRAYPTPGRSYLISDAVSLPTNDQTANPSFAGTSVSKNVF